MRESDGKQNKIYINARFLTQSITGVQRYAHEVVKGLDQLIDTGEIDNAQFQFELLSPSKGVLYDLGLKHINLRRVGFLSGHAWEQFELPLYSRDGLLFCPGNTAPIKSLWSRQRTVVTVHDLSYLYFPSVYSTAFRAFYNLLIPQVLRRANAVITVSQSERKAILSHYAYAGDRLTAIQNGGLSGQYIPEAKNTFVRGNFDRPFVLYVGSLSRRKNFHGILEAISIMNNEEDVNLVVAGAAGKAFNNTEYGIPDHVVKKIDFKGQINDTRELIKLYEKASCLIFPSFYEASPLPPIEAMACGCPVIASTIPSLQERCGDAALYCNPDDPADIAAKVRQLLENKQLADDLREKGLARARMFTWQECARKTFGVIKGVLEK